MSSTGLIFSGVEDSENLKLILEIIVKKQSKNNYFLEIFSLWPKRSYDPFSTDYLEIGQSTEMTKWKIQ